MTSIVTRLRSQASLGEYMEPTLLVERYAKERVEAANIIEALTAALTTVSDTSFTNDSEYYEIPAIAMQVVEDALALAKTHKGK